MHDEVDAVPDRLLADRGCERGVDDGERAAHRAEVSEVDEIEARVRRRLGDDEHRSARNHGLRELARGGAVDPRDVDPHAGARSLQERTRSGVHLALRDDVVTVEHSANTTDATAPIPDENAERVLGALEFGDRLLERPHRGVGVPAVELVGADAGRSLAGVVEARRLPRAGGPQRRGQTRSLLAAARRDGPGGGGLLRSSEDQGYSPPGIAGSG